MGIGIITALEIYTNPGDLEITIVQTKPGDKFAIGIFRGPGHNYKPIITSEPFAEKIDGAIEAIRVILESIHEEITKDFADPKSFPSLYLNPDRLEVNQSKVLNPNLISWILDELRQHKVASTHKMFSEKLDKNQYQ